MHSISRFVDRPPTAAVDHDLAFGPLPTSMTRTIPERDWKIFRELHPQLLQRFCDGVLMQAQTEIERPGSLAHERYIAVYRLMRDRDRELARTFNDLRRSTALIQISVIYSMGLFTDEDLARFGPEIHEVLAMFERGPEA